MTRPLSTEMNRTLLNLVRGEVITAKENTIAGLVTRGFIDPYGKLTHEGWKQAVVMLPLVEQCQSMGVDYEKLSGLDFRDNPELAAWHHFASLGYSGGYCEGGPILLLIRAAALDVLTQLNTFGSRQDACSRFTEAQLAIHKESSDLILDAIRSADSHQVVQNFNEIYSSLMVQEWYPGLTPAAITSLFDILGAELLALITSAIMEDPYQYRAGWADLTMSNGSEMLWAEIKTTDRLHMSQITTLYRMKPLLPGRIRVIQLVA